MDDIVFASATTLAKRIRERQVSAETVITAHLQRIDAINPKINALVQLSAETALKQAQAADNALTQGELWGPLHGVPFSVKDNIETEGVVCTCGTLGLADNVPSQDAIVVARIRAAGGILLGKTNLPEVGMGYETDNLVYGRTNNPYDLARVSGGSSGGEAALIAAGGSPLGIGTDGGGSARWPAHCCGIAGFKPTTGRTPKIGHVPPPGGALNAFWQIGLLARFVEDIALALPIICGEDSRDPTTVPVALRDAAQVDLRQLRIAVYTDDGIGSANVETTEAVAQCAATLAQAGATITWARPPMIEQTHELYYRLYAADGGVGLQQLLESWGTTTVHPYTRQNQTTQSNYALSTTEFGGYLYQLDLYRRSFLSFMDNFDIILCPVSTQSAVPHGKTLLNRDHPGAATMFSYVMAFNLAGWPCGTVRVGNSAENLPLGIQIAARPWREDVVLATLQHLETKHVGWQQPPL